MIPEEIKYPMRVTTYLTKKDVEFLHNRFSHRLNYSPAKSLKWLLELEQSRVYLEASSMDVSEFETMFAICCARLKYAGQLYEFAIVFSPNFVDGFLLRLISSNGVDYPFGDPDLIAVKACVEDFKYYYRKISLNGSSV